MLENDDDDREVPAFTPSGSGLKSLFAMDEAARAQGNDTFQWSKPKKAKAKPEKPKAVDATPKEPLHRIAARLFLTTAGQLQDYGIAMLAVMPKTDAPAVVMAYDRSKQILFTANLGPKSSNNFSVTNDEPQQLLARVTDDSNQCWSIYFRTVEEAGAFGDIVALCKFQAACKENCQERLTRHDVIIGTGPALVTGDGAGIRLRASTLDITNYGAAPKMIFTFDETSDPADIRRIQLGEGKVMQAYEDGLLGMCRGGRRWLIFSAPELLRIRNGPNLPHPAVSPGDTIAVVIDLVKLRREKPQSEPPPEVPQRPATKPPEQIQPPVPVPVPVPELIPAPAPVTPQLAQAAPVMPAFDGVSTFATLPNLSGFPPAFLPGVLPGFPAAMLPGLPTALPEATDTKSLILQAMLQQPGADPALLALLQPEESAKPASTPLSTSGQEALEKILGKMNRMHDKLDKLDLASQLAVNNTLLIQSFRQIARDMIGNSSRSTDAPAEGRRTEQELRQRLLDLQTEVAMAQKLAETKQQELVACQATLDQEKDSTEHRIAQLVEKFQAERVELRLRQKEKLKQVAEQEYQRGLTDGQIQEHKIDSGGDQWRIELEDLREQLEASRASARSEREEKDREIRALQALIERHEEAREQYKNQERRLVDAQETRDKEIVAKDVLTKKLRKAMNGVYFGMEAVLQAKEADGLTAERVMQMLVRVIKSQTKRALEDEDQEEEEEEENDEQPPPPPPPLPRNQEEDEWDE